MTVRLALAGDTMLGRKVAERFGVGGLPQLFCDELAALMRDADLCVVNLECCISDRGERWPDPRKPFFFRTPPAAAAALADLGVDAVSLANNHALDYGAEALLDTFRHLDAAGVGWVGAGGDEREARRPLVLEADGLRLALVAVADHPADYAAGADRPGIAYADLRDRVPYWLPAAVAGVDADAVLVTPHWGPNMVTEPVPHVRAAAPRLVDAGANLVAGHSAHVFHGVEVLSGCPVLYDLGDAIDDYAIDDRLRNDLSLLWLVELDGARPTRVEVVPMHLDYCFTERADAADERWIGERFRDACATFGTRVTQRDGRFLVDVGEE